MSSSNSHIPKISSILTFIFLIAFPVAFELLFSFIQALNYDFEILPVIICGIYLLSALIIQFKGDVVLRKKFLVIILFFILPLASLAIMTTKTNYWYKPYDLKKTTATVYLYNESSSEEIKRITCTSNIPYTLIDKFYAFVWYKSNDKWILLEKKKRAVLKIRPGVTTFEIQTENDKSKKYIVDLNMPDIKVSDGDEIFLCYGGKNFFQFTPDTKARKAIIDGTFTGTISLPEGAPSSKKEETK
ncbi:hypothetical protein [Treponema bryantii]|uniref:hypothetical protein n=1 Tax=Treponema bryantii TaxID=163 RepID=UPI002B2ADBEA|nr:hypothetical protein TRBR_22920 [Treponema bryantii]